MNLIYTCKLPKLPSVAEREKLEQAAASGRLRVKIRENCDYCNCFDAHQGHSSQSSSFEKRFKPIAIHYPGIALSKFNWTRW